MLQSALIDDIYSDKEPYSKCVFLYCDLVNYKSSHSKQVQHNWGGGGGKGGYKLI